MLRTSMIEEILLHSLVVFAITLTITKSKIMGCKRQFVQNRYNAVIDNNENPCFLHEFWNALWNCPMCCGFWVALATAPFLTNEVGMICGTLSVYGLNWLFHCLEDFLYFSVNDETESQINNDNNKEG